MKNKRRLRPRGLPIDGDAGGDGDDGIEIHADLVDDGVAVGRVDGGQHVSAVQILPKNNKK